MGADLHSDFRGIVGVAEIGGHVELEVGVVRDDTIANFDALGS